MSQWLVIIVTILYAMTSISYLVNANIPMGIVFGGYAFANIGLILMGGGF